MQGKGSNQDGCKSISVESAWWVCISIAHITPTYTCTHIFKYIMQSRKKLHLLYNDNLQLRYFHETDEFPKSAFVKGSSKHSLGFVRIEFSLDWVHAIFGSEKCQVLLIVKHIQV